MKSLKSWRTAAASLILIIILAACAQDPVVNAEVREKWYEPEESHTTMWPMYGTRCTSTGKSTSCTSYVMYWYPVTTTDDEDYMVKVWGCEQHHPDVCRFEDWELTKEWWDSVSVGDSITREVK